MPVENDEPLKHNCVIVLSLQDHLNFTLGRQSFNLKHLENATSAFKHLLNESSRQSQPQQTAFLREYLFVFKVQFN